jgi:hypothetical protein
MVLEFQERENLLYRIGYPSCSWCSVSRIRFVISQKKKYFVVYIREIPWNFADVKK